MLPDAEGRLSSIYSSYQSTAKQFPQRATSASISRSPSFGKMETLEEEEEEDNENNLDNSFISISNDYTQSNVKPKNDKSLVSKNLTIDHLHLYRH